jgi:hypothetical protein
MSWASAPRSSIIPEDCRNARITRAACSTAPIPLPRASPMRKRTLPAVSEQSYRSPPTIASREAEL